MFGRRMKRAASLLLAVFMLMQAGAALAAGNTIGNTANDGGTLYKDLINGRKVARQAYLSDRYPTADKTLHVFHNVWVTGHWEKDGPKCRIDGSMSLNGGTYLKGIGMYINGESFPSSVSGAEQSGTVQYTLNGDYDEFYFGIGPDDSDNRYCGTDDGSARVQIYLDNVLAYDSGYFEYNGVGYNQAINVKDANKLKIVVSVRKGSNNSLNVLLTDPLLVDFA